MNWQDAGEVLSFKSAFTLWIRQPNLFKYFLYICIYFCSLSPVNPHPQHSMGYARAPGWNTNTGKSWNACMWPTSRTERVVKMKYFLSKKAHFCYCCRVTSQSESEFNEAPDSNNNNKNLFLKDKEPRISASGDTITIQLQNRSSVSWEFLVNSFNLTTEDLELR